MYYAKTDTAGQDYDEYVSQIIETHDSTYCLLDDECLLFNYTIIKLL